MLRAVFGNVSLTNAPHDAGVSVRGTIDLVRDGAPMRCGFVVISTLLACLSAPPAFALVWCASTCIWELFIRNALERRMILDRGDLPEEEGFKRVAYINCFGAILYALIIYHLWGADSAAAMVLATAWVGGNAVHVFAYFSDNPRLVLANLGPTLAAAILAPLIGQAGLNTISGVAVVANLALMVGASRFIFDRNALLKSLADQIAARRSAEEAAAAKEGFLATMSHELRTPLNAIIGYAEILDEDLEELEAEPLRQDARRISASARNLLALINDILDMSKLEAGGMVLRPVRTDVPALLREVAADVAVIAAQNKTRVIVDVDPDLREAFLDYVKVRQCLLNLASNACKFTDGGLVTISAAARRQDGCEIVFRVADTGIGIAADQVETMFEPFTQAESAFMRRAGGTGLGLAITRKLARLMGGDVSYNGALGVGSTFTLIVPESSPRRLEIARAA